MRRAESPRRRSDATHRAVCSPVRSNSSYSETNTRRRSPKGPLAAPGKRGAKAPRQPQARAAAAAGTGQGLHPPWETPTPG